MASHENMNREEILERYWKGETTLEEEAWLRANGDVHPLFQYAKNQVDQFSKLTLEEITGNHQAAGHTQQKTKVLRFNRWIARIAAGFIILAAATFLLKTDGDKHEPVNSLAYAETYDNPEQAYEEVREALMLISSKINKTSGQVAKQISKAEPYTDIFK